MGLGFIFILLPLSIILLIAWGATGKSFFGKILLMMWAGIFALIIISSIFRLKNKKIELKTEDYYGDYIIDRKRFRGKQADWQYNHYRFTINENNTITLYEIDDNDSTHIFKGKISTVTPYSSARLIIKPDSTNHHFFNSNPTTYRKGKKFYLVFNSTKFSNMYFIKGKWEPIK